MMKNNAGIFRLSRGIGLFASLCLVIAALFTGTVEASEQILGTVEENLDLPAACEQYKDYSLGNFMADAARFSCKADVAFLPNSLFQSEILRGDITRGQLLSSITDAQLVTVVLDKTALIQLLEQSLAGLVCDTEHERLSEASDLQTLLQVSGASYTYDPTAPRCARIVSAEGFPESGPIVAAMPLSTAEQHSLPILETGYSLADSFVSYVNTAFRFQDQIGISRICLMGVMENSIAARFPRIILIIVPLGLAIIAGVMLPRGINGWKDSHGVFLDHKR